MTVGMITILSAVLAFMLTSLIGLWLIPALRRIRCSQTIGDNVPSWHKKKEGTPTMGGLMLAAGTLASCVIGWCTWKLSTVNDVTISVQLQRMDTAKRFLGLFLAAALGAVGFLDDYLRSVKKRPGLTSMQKLSLQCIAAVVYLLAVWLSGDHMTAFYIPFLGRIQLGILYYPLSVLLIVGTVRALDLTDGLDGLCSSVSMVASMGLMMI